MKFLGGIWKRKVNGETLDYYPCPYIVGDIFITTNSIKPEIRYPGTEWEELPQETYLMTASSKYPVKSIGGENEVTLGTEHIPPHKHDTTGGTYENTGAPYYWLAARKAVGDALTVKISSDNTGGGQPHNNMPKFYAIYAYRRIA